MHFITCFSYINWANHMMIFNHLIMSGFGIKIPLIRLLKWAGNFHTLSICWYYLYYKAINVA